MKSEEFWNFITYTTKNMLNVKDLQTCILRHLAVVIDRFGSS